MGVLGSMTVPTDDLYAQQWHFDALGNGRGRGLLERVWDEFSGAGVHVIVYDGGIQRAHHDLDGNYDASRELVINGVPVPVEPPGTAPTDAHGTAVAGILAAENNGVGTVGVAWGATITSAIVVPISDLTTLTDRLHLAPAFDITNNSWANTGHFDPNYSLLVPGGYYSALAAEFEFASATGRGGLGTINVNGAANNDVDANALGMNTSRHTITVAAIRDDGFSASYSNRGACILVSAPGGNTFGLTAGGITTTDLMGTAGLNTRADPAGASDYADGLAGTSLSTPIVSAVAALMLDANPGLGWRDVQNILSLTAFQTGSPFGSGPGLNEDHTWFFNGADNLNGGGLHFSEDYGYGNVDPFGAVRMAEAFAIMGREAQTTANEHFYFNTFAPGATLPGKGTYFFDFDVATFPLTLDHAAITFEITHPDYSSLRLFLISPDGTEVQLYDGVGEAAIDASSGFEWIYGVEAYRGEDSTGTWRLKIVDKVAGGAGTLDSVRIDLYGSAPDGADDIFHFTDEFAAMLALDPARGTIADADGGSDWLNAAALSGKATIDLNPGQASAIAAASLVIAAGTVIENAITGDGNDRLTGNAANNVLHGMRGNDVLSGGGGADKLDGGDGDDRHNGGSGRDILIGGGGNDVLSGGGGRDTLRGGAGGDQLGGGGGGDVFDFNSTADSSAQLPGGKRDTVSDFAPSIDVMDLKGIDARQSVAGNQAFTFINGSAFSAEGQVRAIQTGAGTEILVNTAGNGGAEMRFLLLGVDAASIGAGDFDL